MTIFPRSSEIPTPATLETTKPLTLAPNIDACCEETLKAVNVILGGDLYAANDNTVVSEAAA